MSKYIDAEIAEKSGWILKRDFGRGSYQTMLPTNYPAANVVRAKHGRWIPGREISRDYIGDRLTNIQYEDWRCSNCNCVSEDYRKPIWNYCPNCGWKMDGREDDE